MGKKQKNIPATDTATQAEIDAGIGDSQIKPEADKPARKRDYKAERLARKAKKAAKAAEDIGPAEDQAQLDADNDAAMDEEHAEREPESVGDPEIEGEATEEQNADNEEQETQAGATKAGKKSKDDKPVGPADFLLFLGDAFYTKEDFIAEAAEQGVSRRLPTHFLPKGLVPGKSRVYVAAGGKRVAGTEDTVADIFAYFIPQAVEFIAGPDGEAKYAEIIAELKLTEGSRIIGSIKGEAKRKCGVRKEGGTYLVVTEAETPLVVLRKALPFIGNHFRGLMKLRPEMVESIASGEGISVMVDETCMECEKPMRCAPDGQKNANRERRRMERGEEPKWTLKCADCRKRVIQERVAAAKAAKQPAPQSEESAA